MTHFEWWDKVGSGMPPLPSEDAHEHVQRVTAECWPAARAAIYESEAAQLTEPLRVEIERLRAALTWIATVNAMDYEYQRFASAALGPNAQAQAAP
jgi:hypothetical protein